MCPLFTLHFWGLGKAGLRIWSKVGRQQQLLIKHGQFNFNGIVSLYLTESTCYEKQELKCRFEHTLTFGYYKDTPVHFLFFLPQT